MAFKDSFKRPSGFWGWVTLAGLVVLELIDFLGNVDFVATKYQLYFPNGIGFPPWLAIFAAPFRSAGGRLLTMFVGLGLIMWASRSRTTKAPPDTDPTKDLLPEKRPKLAPIRFGEDEKKETTGVSIVNHGEPAFDISIPPLKHNGVNIIFLGVPNYLSSSGEMFCEAVVLRDGVAPIDDLFWFMREQDLFEIEARVYYRDFELAWYSTVFELARIGDAGGIRVGPFRQVREAGAPPPVDNTLPANVRTKRVKSPDDKTKPVAERIQEIVAKPSPAPVATVDNSLAEGFLRAMKIDFTALPSKEIRIEWCPESNGLQIHVTNLTANTVRDFRLLVTDVLKYFPELDKFGEVAEFHPTGPFKELQLMLPAEPTTTTIGGDATLFCGTPVKFDFLHKDSSNVWFKGRTKEASVELQQIPAVGIWQVTFRLQVGHRFRAQHGLFQWKDKGSVPEPYQFPPKKTKTVSTAPEPPTTLGGGRR
jgi:hypothetical protein